MKRYYLFPNGYSTSFGILIIMAITFLNISSRLHAQSIVNTPCSCTDWTTIGTTNAETDISSIGSLNSSKCYLIKGILVIDQTTFWTNLRLKMEEKSMIRVEAHLSMSNCYLSGCGDMWKGIHTVGQTYLHSYNSFIEDAEFGMKVSGLAGLVCLGTHFINNYIGIASASPFSADTEDKVIHRGQVWGCHFYTSTTLPDPYPGHFYDDWPSTPTEVPYNQGFAAIYLSRTVGLNIGYADADDPDRNKIHDMRNGIILREKTVSNISGTDFYNFEGGIARSLPNPLLDLNQHAIDMMHSVSDIRDNTMDNLMFGIFGLESVNTVYRNELSMSTPNPGFGFTRGMTFLRPQKANIIQNVINEGMRGISIEDVTNDFLILQNELNTTFYFGGINTRIFIRNAKLDPAQGIIEDNDLLVDDALSSTGIHALNANLLTIEDNDIDFLNEEEHQTRGILGVGTYRSIVEGNLVNRNLEDVLEGNNGIELDNSGFNTVFCNTMENFWINLNMVGPDIRTDIISNTMNEGEFGFGIWSPTMLGTQVHHGNKWPVSYGDFGAFIFGNDPIIEAGFSRFIVDVLEDVDFMPNPIGPFEVSNGQWFRNANNESSTFTCYNSPPPIADPDTLSKLILTELSYDQFNDEMTWIVKADIFDMILADPGLTSNAVLDSFYDAEVTTPLGKLITWQNELASRFGEERSLKGLTLDTISELSADIMYIDSILALSPNDSATWIALRVLKGDTLEAEIAELRVFLQDEEDDSHYAYAEIADDLDNLTTTNDLEAYLKEALLFKTDYLLGTNYTSSDSTDIEELALLCPWEGGRAMSTGQELYATIDNQIALTTLDNCPAPSSRAKTTRIGPAEQDDMLIVRPNPAVDIAEIECSEAILEITLYNSAMQVVYKSKPMSRHCSISLSTMPAGAYTLYATTLTEQFTKRIIHVK